MKIIVGANSAPKKHTNEKPPCSTCAKIRAAVIAAANKLTGRK